MNSPMHSAGNTSTTGHGVQLRYQAKMIDQQRVGGFEAVIERTPANTAPSTSGTLMASIDGYRLDDQLFNHMVDRVIADHIEHRRASCPTTSIALNTPEVLLNTPRFPARMAARFRAADIPLSNIVLEIQETSAVRLLRMASRTLADLRMLGFHLSIDHAGHHHTLLDGLDRLVFNELKIDQHLIERALIDQPSASLVEQLIDRAHALHMHVVAMGIKDEATLARLERMGCDMFQGPYFGAALQAQELS